MSGSLTLTGLGPLQTVRMLPDAEAFVVGMPDGGDISCVLSAVAPLPSLPVPSVVTLPVITGNARVGQTPTVTAATWSAIPGSPPGMTREIETRFTIAGVAVTTPLAAGTLAQQVRAEARARHVLGAQQGSWSAWAQSAAVTVGPAISLTQTAEGELIGDGTGGDDFTITITSPAPYIGGPFSVDQSNEGGGLGFNDSRIAVAPQGIIRPSISLTTDADISGTATVGDTFTAVRGLWVYDAADAATVSQTGRWQLGGVDISGATTLAQVAAAAGALTYLETLSGAGTTRTMTSNSITVAGGGSIVVTGRPDGIELSTSGSVTVTGRPDGILVE